MHMFNSDFRVQRSAFEATTITVELLSDRLRERCGGAISFDVPKSQIGETLVALKREGFTDRDEDPNWVEFWGEYKAQVTA